MKATSLFVTYHGVEFSISVNEKDKVTFYGYRSARPLVWLVSIDTLKLTHTTDLQENRLASKAMSFVKDLIEISNGHMDNHITFVIELANGGSYVVMYHDHKVIIGAGAEIGMW